VGRRLRITTIVTDLDNTLFDWVSMWYQSFDAMLVELEKESGIPRTQLQSEFREIHQRHGTSEYAFSIEELPSLKQRYPGLDLAERFVASIDAYRAARRASLRLYPTVKETLRSLKASGCLVIAYTESMAYYSNYRIRRLGLDGLIDFLYSPEDHDLPKGLTAEQIRKYPTAAYQLNWTIHRHTPKGVLKPSADVLLSILREVHANPIETIYVGDSLMKDVVMAQQAGVADVFAGYGVVHDTSAYALLRAVTHWTDEMVTREKALRVEDVKPTFTLSTFGDIARLFDFSSFVPEPIRDATKDEKQVAVDIWKKTVDVQQHFNDLELRIRNFALTALTALVGAAGFVGRERFGLDVGGLKIPAAALILFGGVPIVTAFWFMDRLWYHRLLYGAVRHASFIEQRNRAVLPELGLTGAIGRESPVTLFGWRMRSPRKIDVFYLFLAVSLIFAGFMVMIFPWTAAELIPHQRSTGNDDLHL
jgi:FMN phosphatase YigB (HAD superfamily)